MEIKEKIEILYKEYMRLNARLDQLIDGSFNDFRLLSFIGPIVLGIGTFVSSLDNLWDIEPYLLSFLIFISLLFIVAIIAFRDFLKLSLINNQISTISLYEKEIRILLNDSTNLFTNTMHWKRYFLNSHEKLYFSFTLVIIMPIIIVPSVVLFYAPREYYWLIYLFVSISIYIAHLYSSIFFLKTPLKNSYNTE